MKFIKENPTLAAGIGLPVLLVFFFSLAALIPQWTVDEPRYDFLFTNESYNNILENEYRFRVINGKIEAHAQPYKTANTSSGGYVKKLYRYRIADGSVQEVSLPTVLSKNTSSTTESDEQRKIKSLESAIESLGKEPRDWEKVKVIDLSAEADTWQLIDIPEISSLRIDGNMTAPDGYVFVSGNRYASHVGLFPFFGSSYRSGLALRKNGRTVDLVSPVGSIDSYYYYNSHFLGWILPEGNSHAK